MLEDYTKAEFPHETLTNHGKPVRLFGTICGRVIGAVYYPHGDEEYFGVCLDVDPMGVFGEDPRHSLSLLPPPAHRARRVSQLEDEIATAQGRLDGMPDAPAQWREIDENFIASARAEIHLLSTPSD